MKDEFKLKLMRPTGGNIWEQLGIDEHLQLSIASGLIDHNNGAGHYLNYAHQSNSPAILILRIESREECLDLQNFLKKVFPSISTDGTIVKATHVVVGVTYGVESYCVLTKDLSHSDGDAGVEEAINYLVDLATKLLNSLENNQNSTDFMNQLDKEEKLALARLKCRTYTDLKTESFQEEGNVFDVYKFYYELIHEIQQGNDKAIPITFTLCPLKDIVDSVNGVEYRDVDSDLVARCCQLFTRLEQVKSNVEMKQKKIHPTQSALFEYYTSSVIKFTELVKEKLKNCVLKARCCSDEDQEISTIVDLVDNRWPFNHSLPELWMEYTETEELEIKPHEELSFANSINQLDEELSLPSNKKYFLVLFVPALDEQTNRELETMLTCLTDCKIFEDYFMDNIKHTGDQIYSSLIKCRQVQKKIRQLYNLATNSLKYKQFKLVIAPKEEDGGFGYRCSFYEVKNFVADTTSYWSDHMSLQQELEILLTLFCSEATPTLVEWEHEELDLPFSISVQYQIKMGGYWYNMECNISDVRRIVDLKKFRLPIMTAVRVVIINDAEEDPYLVMQRSLHNVGSHLEAHISEIIDLEKIIEILRDSGYSDYENIVFEKNEMRYVTVDCTEGYLAYNCLTCERNCKIVPYSKLDAQEELACDYLFCPCPRSQHEYQEIELCQISQRVYMTLEDMKRTYKTKYCLREDMSNEELVAKFCEKLISMKATAFNQLDQIKTQVRSFCYSEEQASRYLTRLETMEKELRQKLLAGLTFTEYKKEIE